MSPVSGSEKVFDGNAKLNAVPSVAVWSAIMLSTTGVRLAVVLVVPVPAADQPLSPSALVARTCTW